MSNNFNSPQLNDTTDDDEIDERLDDIETKRASEEIEEQIDELRQVQIDASKLLTLANGIADMLNSFNKEIRSIKELVETSNELGEKNTEKEYKTKILPAINSINSIRSELFQLEQRTSNALSRIEDIISDQGNLNDASNAKVNITKDDTYYALRAILEPLKQAERYKREISTKFDKNGKFKNEIQQVKNNIKNIKRGITIIQFLWPIILPLTIVLFIAAAITLVTPDIVKQFGNNISDIGLKTVTQ